MHALPPFDRSRTEQRIGASEKTRASFLRLSLRAGGAAACLLLPALEDHPQRLAQTNVQHVNAGVPAPSSPPTARRPACLSHRQASLPAVEPSVGISRALDDRPRLCGRFTPTRSTLLDD